MQGRIEITDEIMWFKLVMRTEKVLILKMTMEYLGTKPILFRHQ